MGAKGTFPGFLPALADARTADATFPVYGDQKFNQPWIKLAPQTPTTYWRDKAFPQADVIVNAGLANVATKKWTPEDGIKNISQMLTTTRTWNWTPPKSKRLPAPRGERRRRQAGHVWGYSRS